MSSPAKSALLDLPPSLLLLLHLHILLFPKCDSPEYSSTTLFAPTRPLRERTKTMEVEYLINRLYTSLRIFQDIVSFLIGKIEGKGKCKAVLGGTYPCLQPSDTVAFRVNVTKYLESLRSSVVRPGSHVSANKSHQFSSKTSSSRVQSPSQKPSQSVAWWWSAIVVRKSLLEECLGDKFEKMLLALSTHALFVQLPTCDNVDPESSDLAAILKNYPHDYSKVLARAQNLHRERARSASRLSLRVQELNVLRQRLALKPHKEEDMATDTTRLLAIQRSKYGDLLNAWKTATKEKDACPRPSQSNAGDLLEWLLSIAGCSNKLEKENQSINGVDTTQELPDNSVSIITPNLSLTAVAARHPENIRKLISLPKLTALNTTPSEEPELSADSSRNDGGTAVLHSLGMQDLLNRTSAQNASLVEALKSTLRVGKRVQCNLRTKLAERSTDNLAAAREMSDKRPYITFWMANDNSIDFQTTQTHVLNDPTQQKLLNDLGIMAIEEDETRVGERFESSVLALRNSLKPSISAIKWPDERSPTTFSEPLDISFSSPTIRPNDEQPFKPEHTFVQSRSSTKSHVPFIKTQIKSQEWDTFGIVTPKGPRRSTLLPSMIKAFVKTPLAEDFIGDMSLPNVMDDSFTGDDGRWSEEDDIPFEGHSATLRDMLLNAGDEKESYNLMASSELEDFNGVAEGKNDVECRLRG